MALYVCVCASCVYVCMQTHWSVIRDIILRHSYNISLDRTTHMPTTINLCCFKESTYCLQHWLLLHTTNSWHYCSALLLVMDSWLNAVADSVPKITLFGSLPHCQHSTMIFACITLQLCTCMLHSRDRLLNRLLLSLVTVPPPCCWRWHMVSHTMASYMHYRAHSFI